MGGGKDGAGGTANNLKGRAAIQKDLWKTEKLADDNQPP